MLFQWVDRFVICVMNVQQEAQSRSARSDEYRKSVFAAKLEFKIWLSTRD